MGGNTNSSTGTRAVRLNPGMKVHAGMSMRGWNLFPVCAVQDATSLRAVIEDEQDRKILSMWASSMHT